MGKISGQQVLRGIIYSVSCVAYLSLYSYLSIRFSGRLLFAVSCLVLICLTSAIQQKQTWHVWASVSVAAGFLFLCQYVIRQEASVPLLYTLASIPFFYGLLQSCIQGFADNAMWETRFRSISFLLLGAVGSLIGITEQLFFCFSTDIWKDEAFSLALIAHPWREMLNLAAQDVHPPFYYVILKAITDAVHAVIPLLPVICIAKLVSCLPYVILLAVAVVKVRKMWGNYVAGLFALSLVSAPSLISQGIEIRMYSWAMLFVTLAYISAFGVMRTGSMRCWVCFTLCGLASAYTHYYACIAVTPVYLYLLYISIRCGRSAILNWTLASFFTVAGYLPWLIIFLNQARTVSNDYWIDLPDLHKYASYAVRLLYEAPVAGIVALIILQVCSKSDKKNSLNLRGYVLTGGFCVLFVCIVALSISYLVQPIFIFRYLYPALPCLWLSLILGCHYAGKTPLKAAMAILLGSLFVSQLIECACRESYRSKEQRQLTEVLNVHTDSVFVCDDASVQQTLSLLTEGNCLCFDKKENTDLFKKVFPGISKPNIADFETLIRQKQHPTYVVMIGEKKLEQRYKTLFSPYYVRSFKELFFKDLYIIPATEDGAQP